MHNCCGCIVVMPFLLFKCFSFSSCFMSCLIKINVVEFMHLSCLNKLFDWKFLDKRKLRGDGVPLLQRISEFFSVICWITSYTYSFILDVHSVPEE